MPYRFLFLVSIIISVTANTVYSQKRITPTEAMDNVGLYVKVCEKVVDGVFLENSATKVTLLNIGGAYPDQKLTVVISLDNRKNFETKPEEFYVGKFICFTGRVESRNGKPQIEIFTPPSIIDSADLEKENPNNKSTSVSIMPPEMPKSKSSISDFEAGLSVGTMHAATDVGRKKSTIYFPTDNIRMHVGLYGSYKFDKNFAVRAELNFGSVAAKDANGKTSIQPRGLQFKSNIFELAVLAQISPYHFKNGSIYALGGFGIFSFNPKGMYNGAWIKLHPLSTEGQSFPEFPDRKRYSLTQLCLPFGGGVNFEMSKNMTLRVEGLYRWTSTDYLDDASTLFIDPAIFFKNFPQQTATIASAVANPNPSYNKPNGDIRGGEKTKDKYFSFAIKLGYKFGNR